jgi:inner membrane protein
MSNIRHGLDTPTTANIVVVALVLAAADGAYRLAGDSLFPGALFDETAHLLTALLILWTLGQTLRERLLVGVLLASVLIDLDHVPQRLGVDWLTAGTPRPYTHSLLSIALLLAAAALWRRRRWLMLALAAGLAVHLWRDMSESSSGVSLLWPFTDHAFRFGHGWYVAAMVLITACALVRHRATVGRRIRGTPLAIGQPK